jgi:hypothetical protein
MKKILLLLILLNISYHLFAFTYQGVWRWRNDDGSLTSATWRANQNVPITVANTDSIIRLRVEAYNDGTGIDGTDGVLDGVVLQDSTNESGSGWNTINLTVGSNAFVLAGTDQYVQDLQHTGRELNAHLTYTFDSGYAIVSSESYPSQSVGIFHATEIEYFIKPTSLMKVGVTYYFRIYEAYYTTGYVYPSLTAGVVLPVSMAAFNVTQDKNRVQISWSTAIETNCSRFDVERSTDGFRFSTIATVKGNGTTSIPHQYSVYDATPVNGTNYYRIKQYDTDGRFAVSGIKSINMVINQVITKAFPNPTHADIGFMLQNYAGGTATATLIDLAGKPVHREVIQINNGQTNYKLNLRTQLAPGIYILHLEGNTLSENMRILIQ